MTLLSTRHRDPARMLSATRDVSIAVCVPTVDEAATIGPICASLVGLRQAGAIDRVLVLDSSTDATSAIAEAAGADVIEQGRVRPEFGPVLGKGDAMWRALSVIQEDVVVFVDGDTSGFDAGTAASLAAAIALDDFAFAKATYRRPFLMGDVVLPSGGGRVTELTAKPLLGALLPELRAFDQPLAGEIAARTDVLRALPFATGYAVDVALLIDVWRAQGIERMVQVDTGERQNRHRPLAELGRMAEQVAGAILGRAAHSGRAAARLGDVVERPPCDTLRTPSSAEMFALQPARVA